MTVFRGDANARAVGGVPQNFRDFFVRTDNTTDAPANRNWQLGAGDSITLFYQENTGGLGRPAPTNVTISIYHEDTSTLVRTLHADGDTPPSPGDSFTFHSTTDGTSGGASRDGTYRIYVRARNTGLDPYDVNSDDRNPGALQGRRKYTSLTVSAYPLGASKFALGPAADETASITAVHTRAWGDLGHENIRVRWTRDGTNNDDKTATVDNENDGAGQSTMTVTIDSSFPAASQLYDIRVDTPGLSPLTGLPYTSVHGSGHGAGLTPTVSTTLPGWIRKEDVATVDAREQVTTKVQHTTPRSDTAQTPGHFRIGAMTAYLYIRLRNGRDEAITRADFVLFEIREPDNTLHDSGTRTAASDGWAPVVENPADAPAGDWTYRAKGAYRNANTDLAINHHLGYGPRAIQLLHQPWLNPYGEQRIHARCLFEGAPDTPNTLPEIRVVVRDADDDFTIKDVHDEEALNLVDDTATINGAHYYSDIDPADKRGHGSVEVEATIQGCPVHHIFPVILGRILPPHIHTGNPLPQISYQDLRDLPEQPPEGAELVTKNDATSQDEHGLKEAPIVERGYPVDLHDQRAQSALDAATEPSQEVFFLHRADRAPRVGDTLRFRDLAASFTVRAVLEIEPGVYQVEAGAEKDPVTDAHRRRRLRMTLLERY